MTPYDRPIHTIADAERAAYEDDDSRGLWIGALFVLAALLSGVAVGWWVRGVVG